MNSLSRRAATHSFSALGHVLVALPFLILLACGGGGPSGPDDDDDGGSIPENPGEDLLTIFYTTDERGQIEPGPASEGAAKLMGVWRDVEGLTEDEDFLVLSGGNSWTGTLLSSWFKGEPVVAVMNAMGYDGMAIGDLDFHFGQAELASRKAEAEFPLLSSNVRLQSSGAPPSFATPYLVETVNGLKVGLIGLTPLSTPESNTSEKTEGLEFRSYTDALNQAVPQARAAGADFVVVAAHLCYDEITPLLPQLGQLGVSMIGGAFCGETKAEVVNGVAVVIPRWGFSEYGKVAIRVKEKSKEILGIQAEVKPNTGGSPFEEVEVRVEHWQHQMEEDLSAVVGYLDTALDQRSLPLHNFVMDSWINTYDADIGILNAGAIRAGLPAGDITKGAIVGMLPFTNKLVELELTGAEVIQCLQGDMIFSGMSTIGGYFNGDGTEMKMDSVYTVLTTDFLYGQAANAFAGFDDTPKATEILYSQPTLTYLEALQTSPENPLDQFLDTDPRK